MPIDSVFHNVYTTQNEVWKRCMKVPHKFKHAVLGQHFVGISYNFLFVISIRQRIINKDFETRHPSNIREMTC